MSTIESVFHAKVRQGAGQLRLLGVALLIIGIAAFVFPVASTLAATLFVGWILIFSGAATLYGAFSVHGAAPFFGALLLGLLSAAAGVYILVQPGAGELAITLVLGFLFMLQGAFELAMAFELRPAKSWGWMAISAVASIVLSLAIVSGWPGTSLIALGIILGVNFISSGFAYLMLSSAAKRGLAA